MAPVANFSDGKNEFSSIDIGVLDTKYLENLSTNASSYLWDLGNGIQSTDKNISITYSKSGTYTLKLTVTNSSGAKSSITKVVKVYDYVLKSVAVTNINLNYFTKSGRGYPAFVAFPTFSKVDLWVEIKQGLEGTEYPLSNSGDISAPVVYKSATAKDVDPDQENPILFTVPQRTTINMPQVIRETGLRGISGGYAFNLYVQDSSGTYLISTNRWTGRSTTFNRDLDKKTFKCISYGLGGAWIEMSGALELP